jgi:hypothetical protein
MTTATRTRKPEPRTAHLQTIGAVRVLWLTVGKLTTAYHLEPLASDFGTAYRLSKADNGDGGPEVYDVCLLSAGRSTCECLGHLAHAHKGTVCKHIAALFQLQKRGLLPVRTGAPVMVNALEPMARVLLGGETHRQAKSEPIELDDL